MLIFLWGDLGKDLYVPKYISTKENIPQGTDLSQRALSCASTQACGMVSASGWESTVPDVPKTY